MGGGRGQMNSCRLYQLMEVALPSGVFVVYLHLKWSQSGVGLCCLVLPPSAVLLSKPSQSCITLPSLLHSHTVTYRLGRNDSPRRSCVTPLFAMSVKRRHKVHIYVWGGGCFFAA